MKRFVPHELPQRVVSLVPSLTEALFALGLGEHVVGVTEWCVHPARDVMRLPKVGGTKTPDVAAILALRPQLVIANQEENRRRDVDALERAGVPVWVTYPRTVREAAALLRELAGIGRVGPGALGRVEAVERAVSDAEGHPPPRPTRVFCPIWKRPWMSIGRDTYAHDLLRLCGGENVFGVREERRYPIVELDQIAAAAPEIVLLPDEPYAFGPEDVEELRALPIPAAAHRRIHLIDGTLVSWYGPRILTAIETLRPLLVPDR